MAKYASEVVKQAQAWLGYKESNGTHKKIIDVYNSQRPIPVGYRVKYTDAWCATFVSAVFVKLGYLSICPSECSCPRMVTLCKKMGIWIENENRVPNPGEIIFYDWDDRSNYATTENTGSPEHVGIVEKVVDGIIYIIEGNYSNSVKRRKISVNGRYIRGFAAPKYDAEPNAPAAPSTPATPAAPTTPAAPATPAPTTVTITMPILKKGSKGESVKAVQRMLHCLGYKIGTVNPIDGSFGVKVEAAVKAFQKKKGVPQTAEVDEATWNEFLKG